MRTYVNILLDTGAWSRKAASRHNLRAEDYND